MNVLVISGSLRKKNTYNTCKKIEEYHKSKFDVKYDYVFLHQFDLKLCRGCHLCISHGEEKCPLKDDKDLLIQKIEASDAVILASPNYVMNVSWLMKNFIDRFAYTLHRPKFFNQYFMILITSGSYMGSKQALKALSVMSSGGKLVSKLRVFNSPGMNRKKTLIQDKRIKKAAFSFMKKLDNKKEHKPSFGFLVWFSVFKAVSKEGCDHLPADFDFFKNKQYFTSGKLNIIQKGTLKLFTAFFRILVKRGLV